MTQSSGKNNNIIFAIVCILLGFFIICIVYRQIFANKNKKMPMVKNGISRPNERFTKSAPDSSHAGEYTLYNFGSNRCPHSVQFKKTWDLLEEHLDDQDIQLSYIDTLDPSNENLSFYYNINVTPTIILAGPTKTTEYSGNRNLEDIVKFVDDNTK